MTQKSKDILLTTIAVILGFVVGSFVNGSLINFGLTVYPIEGYDGKDMEYLAKVMPTLPAKFYLFPFLAHAVGTLVAGFLAAILSPPVYRKRAVWIVGIVFLILGILVNIMIPAVWWFNFLDIVLAYIPMAFLGYKLAGFIKKNQTK